MYVGEREIFRVDHFDVPSSKLFDVYSSSSFSVTQSAAGFLFVVKTSNSQIISALKVDHVTKLLIAWSRG